MVDVTSLIKIRPKNRGNLEFARDVLIESIRGNLHGSLLKDAIDEVYSIIKDEALKRRTDEMLEAYELVTVLRYLVVERGELPSEIMERIIILIES